MKISINSIKTKKLIISLSWQNHQPTQRNAKQYNGRSNEQDSE